MVPAVLPSPKKFPTDLCLSGTRPKISQCISVTYDPGAFQTVASILGLRTNEFVRESVKSGISVLYSPLTLLEVWLTGFQSQMLCGLPFPEQVSKAGNCDVGLKPLASQEGPLAVMISPPACMLLYQRCGS